MASIEVTPALVFTALSALGSLLAATWAVSRRSRDWDEVEKHRRQLYGDPENHKKGLIDQYNDLHRVIHGDPDARVAGIITRLETVESAAEMDALRNAVTAVSNQMKIIMRALGARGSGEHDMILAVQAHMRKHAVDAAARASIHLARRRIIADQEARLLGEPLDDSAFAETIIAAIAEEEPPRSEDVTPQVPPPNPARKAPFRTPPPFEPSGGPRFNPEDTGRHRRPKG